jgi:predicted  nucleic acid-binding Zn-ribbon protein
VFKKSDKTAADEKREARDLDILIQEVKPKLKKLRKELKPLEITRMSLSNHFTRKKKEGNWDADVYKELQKARGKSALQQSLSRYF